MAKITDIKAKEDGTDVKTHPKNIRKERLDFFISKTIDFETGGDSKGAYHKDPDDKGKETKWGISKNSFPELDIKKLTYHKALEIYKKHYYSPYYNYIEPKIAFKLFDMGVLMGPKIPIKALQRALNRKANTYLRVDGIIGPMTLTALSITPPEYTNLVYETIKDSLKNKLYWIVIKRPSQKKFLKGWKKRLAYDFNTQ